MEVKNLPERLREEAKTIDYYPPTPLDIGDIMREAADEIERLQTENERLQAEVNRLNEQPRGYYHGLGRF